MSLRIGSFRSILGVEPLSAPSIGATPHCGDHLFRARKPPTKLPPLEVVGGFPSPMHSGIVEPRLASLGQLRNSRPLHSRSDCSFAQYASASLHPPLAALRLRASAMLRIVFGHGVRRPDVITKKEPPVKGGLFLWSIGESNP